MTASAPLIVHVVYRFDVGGLENGVVNLINRMPREPLAARDRGADGSSAEFAAAHRRGRRALIALGKRPGHLVRLYPRLYRLFRDLGPAIVHTRNLAALEAIVPAWAAGVPVRIHGEHGRDMQDPAGKRRRYQRVRRLYRPFVSHYVALSRDLEDYLEQQVGVASGQDRADLQRRRHRALSARPRGEAGDPGLPVRRARPCGWWARVGRMEAVKDPLNLARAFVRAQELEPGRRAGTCGWSWSATARCGPTSGRCSSGRHARIASGCRASATTCRRSCAASTASSCLRSPRASPTRFSRPWPADFRSSPPRVGGNPELVESGMTGTLVPPANTEALARAMLAYCSDRGTARRHARGGTARRRARFSLDRMVADYVHVYERTLAAVGSPVPPAIASRRDVRLRTAGTHDRLRD